MRSPRLALLCSSLLALALAACSGGSGGPQCADGVDNDEDGLIDDADPSCNGNDTEDADDPVRDCNDGTDNDADGLVDFPEDPGCTDGQDNSELNSPIPECDDGEDNDDDGLVDYPEDPGCSSPLQNTETDDCPDGVGCPECANGVDDDDDGDVDYPDDDGCTAASDDAERTADPTACAELPYEQLPMSGLVAGVLVSGSSVVTSGVCGGAGTEKAYEMFIESPVVMVATTDITGTAFDTILYVRTRCGDPETELGCNDNANSMTARSTLTVALEPGFYYLVVDGDLATSVGGFQLQVEFFPGLGTPCDASADDACAPGLVCRTAAGGTEDTCEYPVCNDGRDDDGDLVADYPEDPGCGSVGDDTEDDDCPDGPNCPACADGDDNDGDGEADYPLDLDCASAGQVAEGCGAEVDPIALITDDVFTGNTTGYHDNTLQSSCGISGGLDAVHFLTLPVAVQSLIVDTDGSTGVSDSVLYMETAACNGTFINDDSAPLTCDDEGGAGSQSRQAFGALPAGTYAIHVDGYTSSYVGAYNLHVKGVAVPSAACTDPLFASGLLSCPTDYPCDGAICAPPDCGNTTDDDGDGDGVGFPTDPGCTSILDADESDNCPSGVGCPLCGNGMDDDGDGDFDYPDDINCSSASSNTESCTDTDPIGEIVGPVTTGTTTGLTSNFSGSCISSTGPDKVYLLDLPAVATTLTIDTIGTGFDTVLMLKTAACEATDLACDDQGGGGSTSKITRTDQAAGSYAIVVDGWNGAAGPFTLNVHGTVAPGAACNSPLFPSGALTCAAGEFCNGVQCMPAACNNAIDDDGDSDGNGYPADPGCTSISDNTEDDDCPSGPNCPRCANDLDDDGDTMFDFPLDPSCPSASTDDESGCASATDPFLEITGPVTTGNLAAPFGNDLEPTCVTAGTSGRDLAYELNVPYALQNLYIDTNGSGVNTIVALRANGCTPATDLACDDTSGDDDSDAYIARGATAAGRYAIIVDANTTSTGAFTLNVRGVIPQGNACSPALETSGLFVCAATSHCAGTLGAETCMPFACADGGDNDGDGKADALDPGCLSGADDNETNPATLPQCLDTVENDGDGLTDYPADNGCQRASDPLELTCADTTGVTEMTTAHVTGTTVAAGDNSAPGGTCSIGSAAPDRVYSVTVPGNMTTMTFDVGYNPVTPAGWDRVLYVRKDQCATDLACSASDLVTLTNPTAGTYFVFVDGGGVASGTFQLAVRGTIASGQACDPAQIQAGMFTCATGTTCTNNVCTP